MIPFRSLAFAFAAASCCGGISIAQPAPSPTAEALINLMTPADLQQALQLLKSSYVKPETVSESELSRASLASLLLRLGRGVALLPASAAENPDRPTPAFGEILEGHIGYLRVGSLAQPNLQALDTNLQTFAGKKIDALVLDLRASSAANDFAIGAEFAKRFCPNGKPLFTLRKAGGKQERAFTSDRDPSYHGLLIVLADAETSGAAEAVAGVLRLYTKALILGDVTGGRAAEYSDLPLPSGLILRVAVADAVLPGGNALFPDGIKPDVAVELPLAEKQQVFQQSMEKGMALFVDETERPHLNEAALLAGRNPEIESAEAAQRRARAGEKPAVHDRVAQRAVDLVIALAVYQKR